MNAKNLLDKEIETVCNTLEELPIDSKEYTQAVENLAKLVDRRIKIEEVELNHLNKKLDRKEENDLKFKQMEDERRDKIIKNVLTGVSMAGYLALVVWGTKASMQFELTNTVTTIAGREWFKKLFTKKIF